ncbi:DUF488 domain-containing protein [Streptomyces sp. NPDC021093]|uniref:DUF488 domain-containing protein n=1 Tax=Streptomyces sp. NPDC021093 TaxID=3365112 RepID=UPI0037894075
MQSGPDFRVRRVYEPAGPADGRRVLVDRLWPRGLSKERAAVDEWLRDVTPSNGLRTAYHSGQLDFAGFRDRYRAELAEPAHAAAVGRLLGLARTSAVTLVTAVKEPEHSHVAVLVDHLRQRHDAHE